jgi:hypothetical protein
MPMRYWEQCPKRSLALLTGKGIRRRLSNNVFPDLLFSYQCLAAILFVGRERGFRIITGVHDEAVICFRSPVQVHECEIPGKKYINYKHSFEAD